MMIIKSNNNYAGKEKGKAPIFVENYYVAM